MFTAMLVAGGVLQSLGTVYSDTFEIVDGSIPHILYSRNRAVDFAVDKWSGNEWEVAVHHTRGWGYVATNAAGRAVNNAMFSQDLATAYGTGSTFTFAFRWFYDGSDTSGQPISMNFYGYVTLGVDEAGNLEVRDCAVADGQDEITVPHAGGGASDALAFTAEDRGSWMEIVKYAVPQDTQGEVVIPASIDGKPVRAIGDSAFFCCEGITSVVIPETVSRIEACAFAGCRALATCNIPGGVTNIGEQAFHQTAISSLHIPALTETIGREAFAGCPNLDTACVWPWTRLGAQAFDSTCRLEYTGTIAEFSRFADGCGDDVLTNLIMAIGREHFDGVTTFKVYDDYADAKHSGRDWASRILASTGIAPGVVSRSNGVLEAQYVWPKIEVISFDPASRRITGRVIPQGGCKIAARPEIPWHLGLRRYGNLDSGGVNRWDYTPDVTGYADPATLGEFTHVISEEDFATNRFFRLELVGE